MRTTKSVSEIYWPLKQCNYEKDIFNTLNTQSGFGAVSGVADSRDLEDLYFSGNGNARLAVEMFCYKIAKTMASYFVPLEGMAMLVLEFSREGYKIKKVFGQKSTVVKWNFWILRIGVLASCQKLSINLENKVIYKLMLSKNVNNKNMLLNSYSSIQKTESFGWFLTKKIDFALFDTSPLHQFAKFNDFIWLQLIFSQKPF